MHVGIVHREDPPDQTASESLIWVCTVVWTSFVAGVRNFRTFIRTAA